MEPNITFSKFKEAAEVANLIPLYTTLCADTLTPVSAYMKIRGEPFSFLLESAENHRRWGRYSFIGYDPLVVFRFNGMEQCVKKIEGLSHASPLITNHICSKGDPMVALRRFMKGIRPFPLQQFIHFSGGLVGFVNYDLARIWEPVAGLNRPSTRLPESIFMAPRRLVIFDHFTHTITAVIFVLLDPSFTLREQYLGAAKALEEMVETLMGSTGMESQDRLVLLRPLTPNMGRERFHEMVLEAKRYLEAGDLIQVVLSQKFSGQISGDDFLLYPSLRSLNPSPYMFYLDFQDIKLIGSSPELLVRLSGGKIQLNPIAGTRPRGFSLEQDQMLEAELLKDPKERAEHIMLVDLARNDMGRVALPGSIQVTRFMEVERYSHVMHLVSQVEGRLRPETDCFDLFVACFPAGTVTGAPKIKAMEVISRLESGCRGPYAGAVGYFGFDGNMDFCITIRTMVVMGEELIIQAGAGIVYDSEPEKEYQETMKKTEAMFKALEEATIQ